MGLCAGIFNVGALALMMDMTVKGATGLYMGLWGVAQAIGMGMSSVAAGSLHTGLIGTGLLVPETAYWAIFCAEATLLLSAAYALSRVSTTEFHRCAKSQTNMVPSTSTSGRSAVLDVATASI
jgi:BCD family chlorophyll transporter-like MFS transporter